MWAYRVTWDAFPGRLTRSAWQSLEVPDWTLVERRPAPRPPPTLTLVEATK